MRSDDSRDLDRSDTDSVTVSTTDVGYRIDLPPQLAALNRSNVNVQSLAVERDETALQQAVKLDPLTAAVCTLEKTDEMVDGLLEANTEYLPELD
ncbi:hypothetical protein [Natronorubrum sp. FCH18a]|uniref:hypothetical protein n=1 Tax=Natronorubrum sp. FCH18a TaxID=3447018 RepID=UPI003F517820